MEKIRIQKIIADSGYCSRRKAEELIAAGKVTVNGRSCSLGDKALPGRDVIAIDGEQLKMAKKKNLCYIMLHKPRGYVTTMNDEQGRRCVTELIADYPERVYPVGRLDRNSEGLLLFTNDGALANDIMHPSKHISKTYRVTVRPDVDDEMLAQLAEGVVIDGKKTQPATVLVLDKQPGRVVLQITIHEGRNRQIRKMCEAVGLEVARLKRTSVGPLKLGMLKPGEYRELKPDELRALRSAINKQAKKP
ncbi:MAG: rRNA pseudouridine synthase [Ruminococcus sp.]|nr:rRNA pseudouridine synthase [Ruminococcus sp.]